MTSPGGSLGTVSGKVAITYESTGAAQAVSQVRSMEQALSVTGATAAKTTQQVNQAQGSITQLASATQKLNGVKVTSPVAGLAAQVKRETDSTKSVLDRAIADFQRQVVAGMQAAAPKGVKINPKDITIDRAAFTRAVKEFQASGARELNQNTLLKSIKLAPKVELDDAAVRAAGQRLKGSFEGEFGAGLATKLSGLGNLAGSALVGGIAGGITATAGLVVSAIAAVSLALHEGFGELTELDDAQIRLKALGLTSQQVASVTKTALASIEGTAFQVGDALKVATNAINNGVKPGKELEKYLGALSNTAALASTSMDSLGETFQRVSAEGHLSSEVVLELTRRNVPILKDIAEQYGVTQQAAHQMVLDNKVDFAGFIEAMGRNGTAAKDMANTLGGSFAVLKKSVAELGIGLLAPLFAKDNVGDADIFAAAVQKITGAVQFLGKTVKDHYQDVVTFWEVIGKGALIGGQVFADVLSFLSDAVVKWAQVTGDALGWLSTAFSKVADFFGAHGIAKDAQDAADAFHNLGAGIRENRDANIKKLFDALDKGNITLEEFIKKARAAGGEAGDLGDNAAEAGPKVITLKDALDKLEIKSDSASTALEGTNQQFKDFLKQVKEKGGTQSLLDTLTQIRDQFENGGRQIKSYADAIDKMRDSTASASDKADSLIASLQGLGLLPGGDALKSYNDEFDKMTSYQSKLIDLIDTTGNGLANLDGTINQSTQNGRNLFQQIEDIRKKAIELAASGEVSPDEAYARTVQGLQQVLQSQAGISPDVAQKIIDKYLPKDAIINSLKAQDPKSAIQSLFKDDPAKLNSELNLLTTTQDIINQIVGPDGQLHIPTVLETPQQGPSAPGAPGTGGPGAIPPPPPPGQPNIDVKPGQDPTQPLSPEQRAALGIPDNFPPVYPSATAGNTGPSPSTQPLPLVPGTAVPLPPNALTQQPGDLGGLLGSTPQPTFTEDQIKKLASLGNNQAAFDKALAENPDLQKPLQGLVDQAQAQGQNLSVALAQGITEGDDEVKKALLALAGLAGDYLGNSPAKYGPLSGKGWTLSRGKGFTQDWAKGISSASGDVAKAVSDTAGTASTSLGKYGGGYGAGGFGAGGGVALNDQVKQSLGDLQELSDFGKHILDFVKQIADIGLGVAKFANTLSGGKLFPKSYTPIPGFDARRGSAVGPFNPQTFNPYAPATNVPQQGGPSAPGGSNVSGYQAPVGKPGSREEAAKAVIAEAQRQGLNREQTIAALSVLGQESNYGQNPAAYQAQNQSGTVVTGPFQQDFSYDQYGNRNDIASAAKGFIDQFKKRGQGLNNPNAFAQALLVQRPATIAGGGYDDKTGDYLKNRQYGTAAGLYDSIVSGPGTPPAGVPSPIVPPTSDPNFYKQWYPGQGAGSTSSALVPYGLPTGTDTGGYGSGTGATFPPWMMAIAQQFGVTPSTYSGHQESNRAGEAGYAPNPQHLNRGVDWSGSVEQMQKFAEWLQTNAPNQPGLEQIIWQNPQTLQKIGLGGRGNPTTGYYPDTGEGSYAEHRGHVHTRFSQSLALPDTVPPGLTSTPLSVAQGTPVDLVGQSGTDLSNLVQNTSLLPSMPAQLQDLVKGDPVLTDAMQNQAGLTQDSVVPVLQHLDGLISDQNNLKTPQGKAMADALGGYKTQLQSQFGLQEGPSALDQATSIVSGVSGIASDVFGLFDQGLKVIGADQDIANTLVRGIANTDDVNRIIDDVQETITLVAKGFQTAGDITSFAGSFTGGSDFGATSAAGQLLSLVGQAIQAVNTGIDLAQEGYKIATKYIGRFIQSWLGLSGASDVRYLLDQQTGQVQAYSSDNPRMKTTLNTLGREFGDHTAGTSRQPPINNFTIYQGPGQDPRDTMDDAMFTIRSSGQGAFGYAV